jgi:hypothetical protein
MRWACSRRSASGLPTKDRCRPNPGAHAVANPRACGSTPVIGLSRPGNWRWPLGQEQWRTVVWREILNEALSSRFAAVRFRPALRDWQGSTPHALEWLLVEWQAGEKGPTKSQPCASPPVVPSSANKRRFPPWRRETPRLSVRPGARNPADPTIASKIRSRRHDDSSPQRWPEPSHAAHCVKRSSRAARRAYI